MATNNNPKVKMNVVVGTAVAVQIGGMAYFFACGMSASSSCSMVIPDWRRIPPTSDAAMEPPLTLGITSLPR